MCYKVNIKKWLVILRFLGDIFGRREWNEWKGDRFCDFVLRGKYYYVFFMDVKFIMF